MSAVPIAAKDAPRLVFRPDLQGLRALAVLLVVIFHTGYAMPGGFVGVDVFFVLSGFLIIGLLDREAMNTGRIDLADFFARRARRLLPALSVVTIVTVIASAAVVELGAPLRSVVRTAVGASLFAANAVLYRDADYFAPDAERNPLLHTWSLSVEEQFYFVVPVVLAVVVLFMRRSGSGRSRRRSWVMLLAFGSSVSFAANVLLVDLGMTVLGFEEPMSLAFYAPVTRAWQFGAGGLLALGAAARRKDRSTERATPQVLLSLGLTLILLAALGFDGGTAFPGFRALLPVLGTLLVLLPGSLAGTAPTRGGVATLLSSRVAVRVGDLSYSWYLWHGPAIVLAHAAFGESAISTLSAVLVSLLLAITSLDMLENRFRSNPSVRGSRAVRLAAVCIAAPLATAAMIGVANDRVSDRVGLGPDARPWSVEPCSTRRDSEETWPREDCVRGGDAGNDRGVDILLIGDSHAGSLADGLLEAAERLGLSLGVWSVGGQPPVGDNTWVPRFRALIEQEQPAVLVIASRTSNDLDPESLPRWTDQQVTGPDVAELWSAAVRRSVEGFRDLGPHVAWVLNVPEFPGGPVLEDAVPTLLRPQVRARSITPDELIDLRGPAVPAEIAALESLDRVSIVEPADVLCTPDCRNAGTDVYFYYDSHHLNTAGSRQLADLFEAMLKDAIRSR
jgi:peptidoglycan/LPS O-acetylase OafA/YrhL